MSRVLLVGKGAPEHGGIPSFLSLLLTSDLAAAHDVSLCNLAGDTRRQGARVTAGNLLRTARDAVRVWRAARGRDVVHVHSAAAPAVTMLRAGVLCLAGRLAGCVVVLHAHGGKVHLWVDRAWRRRLVRLAFRPADVVVAVSEEARQALAVALGLRRCVLIDNGVDLERFSPAAPPAPRPTPVILYVGLLSPRKGVLDLIAASRVLSDRGIAHEVRLIGGTPDEGDQGEVQVRAAAAEAPAVRLLGTRDHDDMPALYRDADVFCLPSWWEAMPLSVLEAMASGVAVVASDVGDVGRLLDGGRAGILVAPQDPAGLADALGTLLADPRRRDELGRRGRAHVEARFSADATIAAIDRLYGSTRSPREQPADHG